MSALRKPARQAQRRLWLNRWLTSLGWCLATAAALMVPVVLIDRLWLAIDDSARWVGIIAGSLVGAALLVSLVWALVRRDSLAVAAVRLDEAAGLRERLSSALYFEKSADPFAQAVIVDANRVTQGIAVRRHLPIKVPRSGAYAGGTWVVALLFFWLFPAIDLSGKQAQREEDLARAQQIQRTTAEMKPLIKQQIDQIAEKNPALKDELAKIDPLENAKLETPLDVRREAVKQVENISKKLEARRDSDQLSQMAELKRITRRLSENAPKESPVGDLSKALSKGDFKSANEALKSVQNELAKTAQTPADQARLKDIQKQLDQLANKLEQLAKDDKRLKDELTKLGLTPEELKKALENISKEDDAALKDALSKKGLTKEQTEKLLNQIKQNREACKSACKLAKCLKEGGAKPGQGQGAAAMGQAGEQLSDLEALQQELDSLKASMADLENLKTELGKCKGGQCQIPGQLGPRQGIGQGGVAEKQATDFNTQAKRAKVNSLPGSIISQQFIDGEQFKGDASKDFTEAAIAAQRQVSDAIAREQIPRPLHGPIKEYFTRTLAEPSAPDKSGPTAK